MRNKKREMEEEREEKHYSHLCRERAYLHLSVSLRFAHFYFHQPKGSKHYRSFFNVFYVNVEIVFLDKSHYNFFF